MLAEPVSALRELGARAELLSLKPGQIQAVRHDLQPTRTFAVGKTPDHADPGDYHAVLLPGGAVNAVICHAPRGPVPGGLPRGRTVTGYHTLQDDLRNTGATWAGREVVVHSTLVTSPPPGDVPAFTREMLNLFAAARGA